MDLKKALLQAVSEVLHYIWDPIGVAGTVNARDEYDGYVGCICSLIWSGASAADISDRLVDIADEHIEIHGTRDKADLAAAKLLEWRDAVTR